MLKITKISNKRIREQLFFLAMVTKNKFTDKTQFQNLVLPCKLSYFSLDFFFILTLKEIQFF